MSVEQGLYRTVLTQSHTVSYTALSSPNLIGDQGTRGTKGGK